MRTTIGLAAILWAIAATTHAETSPDALSLTVLAGQHEILRIPKVSSVRSGDRSVVDVRILGPGEVLLSGVGRGSGAVTVSRPGEPDTTYSVSVLDHAPAEKPVESVHLGVGYQKSMKLTGVTRLAVGDPKVAEVRVISANEVLITGIAEGRTSLLVWQGNEERASYFIKVEGKPLEEYLREIKQLLGPMEGINLRIVGERIILDGGYQAVEDRDLGVKVCKLYEKVLFCMPSQD